jgi:hypothetical protein
MSSENVSDPTRSFTQAVSLLFRGAIRGELYPYDVIMKIIHGLTVLQRHYNLHAIKVTRKYLNLKGTYATIYVLLGLYSELWDVVLERLYHYNVEFDVVLVNPGGFHGDKAINLAKSYGFSYVELQPNNIECAQNYVINNVIESHLVIKMDDDVFLTKYTIRNLIRAYKRVKEEGIDIGFLAPVLNVNNVSYVAFLKTLNLIDEYTRLFERPIFARHWRKQKIWYDPNAAEWIWEKSLPLNHIAEIFANMNAELYELIPVRFSINCIIFERTFLLKHYGFSSAGPRIFARVSNRIRSIPISIGTIVSDDEDSINFYADNGMRARILALDSFAGHLAYFPQREHMLKWFLENKNKLLEDLKG